SAALDTLLTPSGQSGIDDRAPGLQNDCFYDALCPRFRIGIRGTGGCLIIADPNLGSEASRLFRPLAMQSEHGCGIAAREAADAKQSGVGEALDRLCCSIAGGEFRKRHWRISKCSPDARLRWRQAGGGLERAIAHGETPRTRCNAIGRVLSPQHLQHSGILVAEQTERDQSTGADVDTVAIAVDLAVASQAVGMD